MLSRDKVFPNKIKKPGDFCLPVVYVREKIRTPDTLVRSQVLYPAELHTHIMFASNFLYVTLVFSFCQEI